MFLICCVFILNIAKASRATTCGYKNGDPQSARTAQSGYGCRVDTANGLWGFCPTTVISAGDCGLAGVCVDSHSCTEGCGRLSNRVDITTFSCERSQFCSTLLLINGPDQSFEYIACGAEARTDKPLPASKAAEATTTPSISTSVPSIPFNSRISQPIATVVETSVPASSSSSAVHSSLVSSTSGSISTSSKQEPMNLGAIVGGVIGGLTVICLTIIGIVLIQRKHEFEGQVTLPPGHTDHGWNELTDNASPNTHNSGDAKKSYQRSGSHGPVEMYSGYHINMEPVELSAQVHCMDTPKGTK